MNKPKPNTPSGKAAQADKPAFTFKERMFIQAQHLAPQHLLSNGMYHLARLRWEPLKKLMIDQAIKRYGVDLSEAENPDPAAYDSFNDFFTRALHPDARPIPDDLASICCPADGRVNQAGAVHKGRMVQAKGHAYSLHELLGGEEQWTKLFANGQFINIYLSPQDYHRVHMPRDGILHRTVHIPGKLFSVNSVTTRAVPQLFTRNERLCCLFESDIGPMAVILVGAIFVASIETVWGAEYLHPKEIAYSDFGPPAMSVELKRGEEMGRFNMGSTVIVLFSGSGVQWAEKLKRGMRVKMGQRIGQFRGM